MKAFNNQKILDNVSCLKKIIYKDDEELVKFVLKS